MNDPKVSVIMGIYNCGNTLTSAIDSIINQTYTNWELIMCDDASTDNTVEIAEKYVKQYPQKILLIKNNKNYKLAYSLNQCLKLATGQYVARMDADDVSLPMRLEKQVQFLDSHKEFQVVACRAVIFDENGDYEIRGKEGEKSKKELLTSTPFMHPTIMMRREAYQEIGGYTVAKRTERGQDCDMWFKFYAKNFRGYQTNDVLYRYYESCKNSKNKSSFKKAKCYASTMYNGFKLVKFPFYYYVFILKPFISACVPWKLKKLLRNKKK